MKFSLTMIHSEFIDIGPTPDPYDATYKSMNIFLELQPQFSDPIKVDPNFNRKGFVEFLPVDKKLGDSRTYYEAIGFLMPHFRTTKLSRDYPLLDCSFPLFINEPEYIYLKGQKKPVNVSRFKDFKIGDLIKVTGYLQGCLAGGIVTTEDEDVDYLHIDNSDLVDGYSVITRISKHFELETENGSELAFEFDIPFYKWNQKDKLVVFEK